jgi:hypothetical protein
LTESRTKSMFRRTHRSLDGAPSSRSISRASLYIRSISDRLADVVISCGKWCNWRWTVSVDIVYTSEAVVSLSPTDGAALIHSHRLRNCNWQIDTETDVGCVCIVLANDGRRQVSSLFIIGCGSTGAAAAAGISHSYDR